MPALNLTFDVELEFVCVFPKFAFTHQDMPLLEGHDHVSAAQALHHFLNRRGVAASSWHDPVLEEGYSKWIVQYDALNLSDAEAAYAPSEFQRQPIELSSRVFNFANDNWRLEIHKVLATLRWMEHRSSCKFITNATTGMHVHVGSSGATFSLSTLRNVFQLMTAHERALDSMHAATRIPAIQHPSTLDPDDDYKTPNYAPLSFFHKCLNSLAENEGSNPFAWLQQTQDVDSLESLAEIFGIYWCRHLLTGHNASLNFDNLYQHPDLNWRDEVLKQTIEFRQHIGTLDLLEIQSYVSLLCSLVHYCHQTDDADFVSLLARAADPNFTLTDLLTAIGLSNSRPEAFAHFTLQDEIIGFLPLHPLPIGTSRGRLRCLIEQNDDEQSENSDNQAAITKKLANGFYGWDITAPALPADDDTIVFALRSARADTQDMSRARSVIFAKLSKMYDALVDSAEDPEQVAAWFPLWL